MITKLNSEVWELWLRRYDQGTAKDQGRCGGALTFGLGRRLIQQMEITSLKGESGLR
jgi:hypothetical protein